MFLVTRTNGSLILPGQKMQDLLTFIYETKQVNIINLFTHIFWKTGRAWFLQVTNKCRPKRYPGGSSLSFQGVISVPLQKQGNPNEMTNYYYIRSLCAHCALWTPPKCRGQTWINSFPSSFPHHLKSLNGIFKAPLLIVLGMVQDWTR